MKKVYVTWEEVFQALDVIDKPGNIVYGVPKGGMIAAGFLKRAKITHDVKQANVILDDIIDSGKTMKQYAPNFLDKGFHTLFNRQKDFNGAWVVFPWEANHPAGEDTVEDNVLRIIQHLGEDVSRDGLKDTPARVVRSWGELYKGYSQDPSEVFTVFEKDGYDQIVLLKNIEIYSTCEHHMLPFFGKAHVAYIPDKKVVGISKLARLVDIYARRLQIQERIGEQVTRALMECLKPKAAACIIEATHMCMLMRGVEKQNSVMTTSSMKGLFMDEKAKAKEELMQLLRL